MDIKEAIYKSWKNRKLVFDILTIFMLIMTISIVVIITTSYKKNYHSILQFSEMTIKRAAERVFHNLSCIVHEFEKIPEISSASVQKVSDISATNSSLLDIMKQQIQSYPTLAACYLATVEGTMLGIFNTKLTEQKNFRATPSSPIPPNTQYSLWMVDKSTSTPKEFYIYFDKDFNKLAQENITPSIYDPRIRTWYLDASKNKATSWTEIYKYYPSDTHGITVAAPILDAQNNFIGVSGADLVLNSLSDFLLAQQVGKTGKAFIVNETNGDILLPIDASGKPVITNIDAITVNEAYSQNVVSKKEGLILDKNDDHLLCGFQNIRLGIDKQWMIIVIAPLNDFVASLLKTQHQIIIISLIIFIVSGASIIVFSKRISGPIETLASEIDKITQLNLDNPVAITSNIYEVNVMETSIIALRNAIKSFARYLPKEMVRQLIKKGQEINIGGEKKELVIMFSDIKGFTGFAEKLPVDTLVRMLTEHFDTLSEIILKTGGTIDKFIGDSIMAFWGAPDPLPYPRTNACLSALRCQAAQRTIHSNSSEVLDAKFISKFGIDAGIAIVGNIGAQQRINYTAIGDSVNTASRLQGLNNTYQTSIIISDNVYQLIKDNFITRPLDIVLLKGRHANTKIYELVAENSSDTAIGTTPEQKAFCNEFRIAFEEFEIGNKDKALELLTAFLTKYPGDTPAQMLIKKITQSKQING